MCRSVCFAVLLPAYNYVETATMSFGFLAASIMAFRVQYSHLCILRWWRAKCERLFADSVVEICLKCKHWKRAANFVIRIFWADNLLPFHSIPFLSFRFFYYLGFSNKYENFCENFYFNGHRTTPLLTSLQIQTTFYGWNCILVCTVHWAWCIRLK